MTKHILPYILLAAAFLTACHDEFEPQPVPSGSGMELILNVNAGERVITDKPDSRAADNFKITNFEKGDSVGLIIFNQNDSLLVENQLYIYDGDKWNTEKQVYFDRTMNKYIVYYPYHASVDSLIDNADKAKADIDNFRTALKNLYAFRLRYDQTKEYAYRYSDPMVFYASGDTLTRTINATLKHLRNSFCLDPKVKCMLNNGKEITYRPKSYILNNKFLPTNIETNYQYETGFEELKIYKDGELLKYHDIDIPLNDSIKSMNIVYEAEDGSFRYIVPEDTPMTFRWQYFYRGNTYAGTYDTTKEHGFGNPTEPGQGVRFLADETADIGKYAGNNLRVSDYFCKGKDDDGKMMGFPFPWEAVDELEPEQCLGVIFHLTLTGPKYGAYSPMSEPADIFESAVYANPDHGYVLALTDAPHKKFPVDSILTTTWSSDRMKDIRINPTSVPSEGVWSGYQLSKRIQTFIEDDPNVSWNDFPAAKDCNMYDSRHDAFKTPENTSGWYLPSYRQLVAVSSVNATNHVITARIAVVRGKLKDSPANKHPYKENVELLYYNGSTFPPDNSTRYHWTSSEENPVVSSPFSTQARIVNLWHYDRVSITQKGRTLNVRPILTF